MLTCRSTCTALETLRAHPDPELLCQLVPQLVRAEPTLTIDLVIAQGRKLRPASLMPRLILADTSEEQVRTPPAADGFKGGGAR